MSIGAEVAYLTRCELCKAPTACMPGPRSKQGRPAPPNGFELGYLVELAKRDYPICAACLNSVLNAA